MQLTILIDNTPSDNPALVHEHGLSIFFTTKGHRFLLDTGLTGRAIRNAATMGIDLTQTEALILSHGHNDHTGGLERFLLECGNTPVYASRRIATCNYQSNHHAKQHSLSPDQRLIEEHSDRFRLMSEDTKLSQNVWLVFCRHNDYARPKGNRWQTADGHPYEADDEMAVAVEEEGRLHIIASCSHAGMLNIIRSCQDATGTHEVASYTGGLHLLDDADDDVDAIADQLLQIAPAIVLHTGHCTGQHAAERLAKRLGPQFHLFRTGECFLPHPA